MKSAGYIKLYRKVFDNKRLFPKPYTEGVAWLWLLCFAAYNDMTVEIKSKSGIFQVSLKRGEIAGSLSFFAEKFSWSRTSFNTFLKYLKKENMITTRVENNMTVILILNYDEYQNGLKESVCNLNSNLNTELNTKINTQSTNNQDSYNNDLNSNLNRQLNSNLNEKYKYIKEIYNLFVDDNIRVREKNFANEKFLYTIDARKEEKSSAKKEEEPPTVQPSINVQGYSDRLYNIISIIANSDEWKDFIKSKGIITAQSREWLHQYYNDEKLLQKHAYIPSFDTITLKHRVTEHLRNYFNKQIELQQKALKSDKPKSVTQEMADLLKKQGIKL
ncbi:MAG: hypothetical protein J6P44_02190 [Bacteroidales bacterium]|nr:hypothetical protein [Bacteroidales bacterium]